VAYAFHKVEKITQYPPGSVAFSPDGTTIVYGTQLAKAIIRKPFTDDPGISIGLDNVPGTAPQFFTSLVHFVTLSPDGQTLAMVTLDGKIRLWKVADGTLLHEINANSTSMAFSPNCEILASGSPDGTLQLWGVADGNLILTLK
jgi:WD40 repeat protein